MKNFDPRTIDDLRDLLLESLMDKCDGVSCKILIWIQFYSTPLAGLGVVILVLSVFVWFYRSELKVAEKEIRELREKWETGLHRSGNV